VNVISSKTPDLTRAGAVSVAFLDAAGDQLQDVCISFVNYNKSLTVVH